MWRIEVIVYIYIVDSIVSLRRNGVKVSGRHAVRVSIWIAGEAVVHRRRGAEVSGRHAVRVSVWLDGEVARWWKAAEVSGRHAVRVSIWIAGEAVEVSRRHAIRVSIWIEVIVSKRGWPHFLEDVSQLILLTNDKLARRRTGSRFNNTDKVF